MTIDGVQALEELWQCERDVEAALDSIDAELEGEHNPEAIARLQQRHLDLQVTLAANDWWISKLERVEW